MENNSLQQLQQQYFSFCTELIRNLPFENINADKLLQKAFFLRDNLEKEILLSQMDCKNNCLKKIVSEIQKLNHEQESAN
jgi:hypothetical protein